MADVETAGPVTVEFIGGPMDGLVQQQPDLRSPWFFPVLGSPIAPGELYPTAPVTKLVYEVVLDPEMGRPSLSDRGLYRFQYTGLS